MDTGELSKKLVALKAGAETLISHTETPGILTREIVIGFAEAMVELSQEIVTHFTGEAQ